MVGADDLSRAGDPLVPLSEAQAATQANVLYDLMGPKCPAPSIYCLPHPSHYSPSRTSPRLRLRRRDGTGSYERHCLRLVATHQRIRTRTSPCMTSSRRRRCCKCPAPLASTVSRMPCSMARPSREDIASTSAWRPDSESRPGQSVFGLIRFQMVEAASA